MYSIIGADGREYGPVTAETVREWIAQGRANRYSRARAVESSNWTTLGEMPEFASLLDPAPQETSPPPPSASSSYTSASSSSAGASAGGFGSGKPPPQTSTAQARVLADQVLVYNRSTSVGACLGRGWTLMTSHFWLTVGASTIMLILLWASTLIPVIGSLLLGYVLFGGLNWMFLKLVRGERAELADAFAGFGPYFVPLMIFSLLSQVLFMLGLFLFILPAFYVMVVYMLFPTMLILDKGLDFWPAMEVSRHVAQRHFWPLLGLSLLACLMFIVGILACIVGVFVVCAWFTAAFVYAYEDLFGRETLTLPQPAI